MDKPRSEGCEWKGCRSNDVQNGDLYCIEHKRQHEKTLRLNRPPQSDKNQALSGATFHPPSVLPSNPATTNLTNRALETGSSNSFHVPISGIFSAVNEKKQLPDKKVARKSTNSSTKQSPSLGLHPMVSTTSPIRRPAVDMPSMSPRPAKRQRLTKEANGPVSLPRTDSSSFSRDRISHPAKRGMLNQSEEKTRKLSAVDDFALRPTKREAAIGSSGSKGDEEHPQAQRGEIHHSSSRQTNPTLNKISQPLSQNGKSGPGSFVIDLTADDDLEPRLPRSKPSQVLPKKEASKTTGDVLQKQHNVTPQGVTPVRSGIVPVTDRQRWGEASKPPTSQGSHAPQTQAGKYIQIQHSSSVEQGSRNSLNQKIPQSVLTSTSPLSHSSRPANGVSSEPSVNNHKPSTTRPLSNGIKHVRNGSSAAGTHEHYNPPSINARQVSNGIRAYSLSRPAPFHPDSGSIPTTSKKPTKPTLQVTHTTDAPRPREVTELSRKTHESHQTTATEYRELVESHQQIVVRQPTVQKDKHAAIPNTTIIPPQTIRNQSPQQVNVTRPAVQNGKSAAPQGSKAVIATQPTSRPQAPKADIILQSPAMGVDSPAPHQTSEKQKQAENGKSITAQVPNTKQQPRETEAEPLSLHRIRGNQQPVVKTRSSTPQARSTSTIPQPQEMQVDPPSGHVNSRKPQPVPDGKPSAPNTTETTPQTQAMDIDSPPQSSEKQQEAHTRIATLSDETPQPATAKRSQEGPLTALLGGRKWTKMTPEERRLFWVSQHDEDKFDEHIYSENNRPIRPGDVLFGLPEYELPPRPTRPATSFAFIDPRIHFSQNYSDEWYWGKQAEICARNRKGKIPEMTKEWQEVMIKQPGALRGVWNPATPLTGSLSNRDKDQAKGEKEDIPQFVRDNPKWMAALEVMKQIEEKNRNRRTNKEPHQRRQSAMKLARAALNAEEDTDADVDEPS